MSPLKRLNENRYPLLVKGLLLRENHSRPADGIQFWTALILVSFGKQLVNFMLKRRFQRYRFHCQLCKIKLTFHGKDRPEKNLASNWISLETMRKLKKVSHCE